MCEKSNEPTFELEDNGCSCNELGLDSDWYWNVDNEVWRCSGCGETQ